MSSEFRPGGPLASTPEHPVQIIKGGFHCSDLRIRNGVFNAGVMDVINNEVKQIVAWVGEWKKGAPKPVEVYQKHGPIHPHVGQGEE